MDEHNLFVIKSYVPMLTLTLHNQEVCVNRNNTCSSVRGMLPLGIKQYEAAHSQYHFTLFCFQIQSIKPLTSKIILAI
jgi:hypothetical protein